jgi:hypothetical protein
MLGSNQRPPPCKGGATLFQGFLQSTNFLQTGAFSVVRFSRFFSIFARVAARLLHMRCSQSRHRRQPLIGVGGAEDLRLAAVWQPEVRELAVLVLEREPQATSTLSPSDVLFVGICTTHCQITVNLALTRVPGPGACGWTLGRAPPAALLALRLTRTLLFVRHLPSCQRHLLHQRVYPSLFDRLTRSS